jgi:hypothetical protein
MDHQPLNTGEQKDMAEFFIDLVSKLEEMTPELKNLVKTLFGGVISNNVVSLVSIFLQTWQWQYCEYFHKLYQQLGALVSQVTNFSAFLLCHVHSQKIVTLTATVMKNYKSVKWLEGPYFPISRHGYRCCFYCLLILLLCQEG